MYKSNTSTMFTSPALTPKPSNKITDTFHKRICSIKSKPSNSYAQQFKKRVIYQQNNKLPLGCRLLNRSVQKYSSIHRSRQGSIQKVKQSLKDRYKTNHMQIQSNILNISINSCGSVQNEDNDYHQEHNRIDFTNNKYKNDDDEFIKPQDFIKTDQKLYQADLAFKNRLNQQFEEFLKELEQIKSQKQQQSYKVKTLDKIIKDKKKSLTNQKKPMNPKEGLSSLQHQLNKQITKLDSIFRKSKQVSDKNTMKLKIQLEGLKQKYQNLNQKEIYLIGLKKEEEQRQIEYNKEVALLDKQRKLQNTLMAQFNNIKQQAQKLQMRLNRIGEVQLPSLDIHKKYIGMLQRAFVERQLQKIDTYLTGKKEHFALKKKSSKIKDQMGTTKTELEQVKKKLEERNKKMSKLKDQMVEKSRVYMQLSQQQQNLDAVRLSK